jgi:hypothetical protein
LLKAGADVSATYGRAQADFPSLGNFFNQISGGAASVLRSTAIHTLLFDSEPRPVQYRRMEPIESIVAAYVRLRNRKALDDLRAHWGRLTAELKSLPGPYDASKVIAQLDNEIAIIDAGLSLLDTAAAA